MEGYSGGGVVGERRDRAEREGHPIQSMTENTIGKPATFVC